jgi:hypothetical protein
MLKHASKVHARTIQLFEFAKRAIPRKSRLGASLNHVHFCVVGRFKCRVLLLGGSLVLVPCEFHLLGQFVGRFARMRSDTGKPICLAPVTKS